jgi:hypothetical protein
MAFKFLGTLLPQVVHAGDTIVIGYPDGTTADDFDIEGAHAIAVNGTVYNNITDFTISFAEDTATILYADNTPLPKGANVLVQLELFEEVNTGGGGGVDDHGDLTGLADDDHTQYHNDTRGDLRYYTKTQLDGGALDALYYTSALLDAGQLDTRYYTQAEIDAALGEIESGTTWELPVLDINQNTPPVSPTTGDRYILGASPTGAWAGHAEAIAEYNGSGWDFEAAVEGAAATNLSDGNGYRYNGSDWVLFITTNPYGEGDGIDITAGVVSVKLDAAGAITLNSSQLRVAVDDVTVERNANALRVKPGGLNTSYLSDFDVDTPAIGDTLQYNGTDFANVAAPWNLSTAAFLPRPDKRNWFAVKAAAATYAGIGVVLGTNTGTLSASNDANGTFVNHAIAATAGSTGGNRSTSFNLFRCGHDPVWVGVLRTGADITNLRIWAGIVSTTPTNSDTGPASHACFRYSSGVSGNWFMTTRAGGTQTSTSFGTAVAANTTYVLKIRVVDGVAYFSINGGAEQSIATNVPADATEMGYAILGITTTASAKDIAISRIYAEYTGNELGIGVGMSGPTSTTAGQSMRFADTTGQIAEEGGIHDETTATVLHLNDEFPYFVAPVSGTNPLGISIFGVVGSQAGGIYLTADTSATDEKSWGFAAVDGGIYQFYALGEFDKDDFLGTFPNSSTPYEVTRTGVQWNDFIFNPNGDNDVNVVFKDTDSLEIMRVNAADSNVAFSGTSALIDTGTLLGFVDPVNSIFFINSEGTMIVQGQNTGQNTSFAMSAFDADGTDDVVFLAVRSAAGSDVSLLGIGWSAAIGDYIVATQIQGSETEQALNLFAGSANAGQLRLTPGNLITMTGMPVLPNFATTSLGAFALQDGMIYYDTTLLKVRARVAGAWVDLH